NRLIAVGPGSQAINRLGGDGDKPPRTERVRRARNPHVIRRQDQCGGPRHASPLQRAERQAKRRCSLPIRVGAPCATSYGVSPERNCPLETTYDGQSG